jgi:phage shock protein PspC (stress-responsive transcriptional regulator)
MDDMNETSTDPGTQPGPAAPGHGPRRPHQDLDRLRRSVDDRYIAGVAGGIGRHFGIDPTVIRVLLAVLTFFGGAGVLVYAVCWLFVPEDGSEHSTIRVGSEPRKLLILAAAGIGVLLVMGHAFAGFGNGWFLASLAVVVAVVLIARDRKDGRKADRVAQAQAWAEHRAAAAAGLVPPYAGAAYTSPAPDAPEATTAIPPYAAVPPLPPTPPAPPAWQPPQPPVIPPRPKRTGVIWFWPTLALIAIGTGVLGIIDVHHALAPGAYPVTALAITGVMLLIGSVTGRPGGLILLGFVSTFALTVATVVGGFNFSGRNIEETPGLAAQVQSSYTVHNGRIELDLTQVKDPAALAGRTIHLSLKAGEIRVIVPKDLNVDLSAEFDFAGGIRVPGYDGGGVQDSVERHLVGTNPDTPALDLELDATVGQITVEQR